MTHWEDRGHERRPVQLDTPIVDTRSGRFLRGRTRDLSMSGVFIELQSPLPVGVLVDCFLGGIGMGPQVLGRVVRNEGDGLAVQFTGDASAVARLLS